VQDSLNENVRASNQQRLIQTGLVASVGERRGCETAVDWFEEEGVFCNRVG
jgi:hypothetical protein